MGQPSALHPILLRFNEPDLERSFVRDNLQRFLLQGRVAILVGILIYVAYGTLDLWFVASEARGAIWTIRGVSLALVIATFVLTWTPQFQRLLFLMYALVGLYAGASVILICWLLPLETTIYYYTGMVLITFFTYNLVGTRFIYALGVGITLLIAYNTAAQLRDYPTHYLFNHNFFIVSANLIGGAAGYLAELQRRQLYLHETRIDRERRINLHRALHDRLTGLPNRELLDDRLEHALAHTQRSGHGAAALFIDLDSFKSINDGWGHAAGDEALRETARRLKLALRDSDTVCRLGGDEFFVLVDDVDTDAAAQKLAEKLQFAISGPIPTGGTSPIPPLTASIGIRRFPYPGQSPADIVRQADAAMYRAKRAGKCRVEFASD